MRKLASLALVCAAVALARAEEPPISRPEGFVTDRAGVLSPPIEARLVRLLEELQAKTGAEIAVLTVETTRPLDDFTYALRVAEAWKPGRRGEDTGIVFLVAAGDRKLRILVGYGLEGILPDGLVGEIADREVLPAFRAGRLADGVERGVEALAARIAAARGVALTGIPPLRAVPESPLPGWVVLLVVLAIVASMLYQASHPARFRRGGSSPYFGGFGGSGGAFGGGGGGFDGFGGGSFGGGGAGRSW